MQGITVAISPQGITFFVQTLTATGGRLHSALSSLTPPDRSIPDTQATPPIPPVPDFDYTYFNIQEGQRKNEYNSISIQLTNGNITSYNPVFQSLQQQENGAFQLVITSGAFSVSYTWNESYYEQDWYMDNRPGHAHVYIPCQGYESPVWKPNNAFGYGPTFGNLDIAAIFSFAYNASNNSYTLPINSITATANSPSANIPGSSIIQHQDYTACVGYHLDDATTQSVDNIDFKSAIQVAVGGYLTTIPASGQLTPDIAFAFGVGDSQLAFPNDQGLTVGVTGISTYTPPGQSQPQQYPGTPPTNLPVPAVPTDGHHLQMYVSDYAINGLYWAFANAGLLTETVTPTMLQQMGLDPSVLDVSTYYNAIPSTDPVKQALAPYRERVMYAKVSPALERNNLPIPPTVTFQTMYLFDGPQGSVMQSIQNALSSTTQGVADYNNLEGSTIPSSAYANAGDLVSDLTGIGITDLQGIQVIEAASQGLGAVVTHALELTCTIQNATLPNGDAPFFTFTLTRQDILTNLVLGLAPHIKDPVHPQVPVSAAQTLQFTHIECQPSPSVNTPAEQAQFSNFIPLKSAMWFTSIWATVGEQQYSALLVNLGRHGVPLPIMQGFQFVFENALTNLEQGYIGILTNVEFTS